MLLGLKTARNQAMSTVFDTPVVNRRQTSPQAAFLLYWRFRPNHPWNLEEFSDRSKAHNRFFNLLERGIEARFETVREATTRHNGRLGSAFPQQAMTSSTLSVLDSAAFN